MVSNWMMETGYAWPFRMRPHAVPALDPLHGVDAESALRASRIRTTLRRLSQLLFSAREGQGRPMCLGRQSIETWVEC